MSRSFFTKWGKKDKQLALYDVVTQKTIPSPRMKFVLQLYIESQKKKKKKCKMIHNGLSVSEKGHYISKWYDIYIGKKKDHN